MTGEIESHLSTVELVREAIPKLPKVVEKSLEFQMRQLVLAGIALHDLLAKLKDDPPGATGWALRRKRKIQRALDAIASRRQALSETLVVVQSTLGIKVIKSCQTDTERIATFVQGSLRRRQDGKTASTQPEIEMQSLDAAEPLEVIAGSDLRTKETPKGEILIVEERTFDGNIERDRAERRIHEVATVFRGDTPEDRNFQATVASIAQCRGYMMHPTSMQLIMETPLGTTSVQSLRQLLDKAQNSRPSLNVRLDLARSIAKAVFFTHAYQYVHKNLRPANILLCQSDGGGAGGLGQVLLAGFGDARAESASSRKVGDNVREFDIYRHPARAAEPDVRYTFLHDVYSLGVCLLEIGIWTDFLDPKVANYRKGLHDATPVERQRNLVRYASKHLAKDMGDMYADVVIECLGCVESGLRPPTNTESLAGGGESMAWAKGYIDIVLDGLGNICI